MEATSRDPGAVLARAVESGRIHSAYLLSGPGAAPRDAAQTFVRALVCEAPAGGRPCEACRACRRSHPPEEPLALDGAGRKGPLLRHVGDHPDLLWIERGPDDTRVRIGQVRALQAALRLRGEGGRRAAVVADAEWLNQEAQNALLRLLEEPPPDTALVLVAASPAGLLVTVRSRCQRLAFPSGPTDAGEPDDEERALFARLEALGRTELPTLLDWAEEMRGPRAVAAAAAGELLGAASRWLHRRACDAVRADADPRPALEAFRTVQACRKALVQRNANPQMVAERALLAVRESLAP
jgi:hypothetical protein